MERFGDGGPHSPAPDFAGPNLSLPIRSQRLSEENFQKFWSTNDWAFFTGSMIRMRLSMLLAFEMPFRGRVGVYRGWAAVLRS